MTRHLRRAAPFLAIIVVVALVVDYAVVRSKEHRLSLAVSKLGGRMGSLPAWPFGTEYRITFHRPLNQKELDQLEIANRMRGWVGIAFQDFELSEAQMVNTRAALPACHLFVARNDTMVPICL